MSTESDLAAQAPAFAVKSLSAFAAAHGGSARAVIQPVGDAGVRITLVGADGVLGSRVVDTVAQAQAAVAASAAVEVAEGWERELTSVVTPAKGHWAKMAGWVARQRRFPKARNER